MIIGEVRKCLNCRSKLEESADYYACKTCGSSFSRKDMESLLQDKRLDALGKI